MKISLTDSQIYLCLDKAWVWYPVASVERLAKLFREQPEAYAQELADRLDAALKAYNEEHQDAA
jgi:hypothetical protein